MRVVTGLAIAFCVAAAFTFFPWAWARVRLVRAKRQLAKEQRRAVRLEAMRQEVVGYMRDVLKEDSEGIPFLSESARRTIERIVRDEGETTK